MGFRSMWFLALGVPGISWAGGVVVPTPPVIDRPDVGVCAQVFEGCTPVTYYVANWKFSPVGMGWGTADRPFATIQEALDAAERGRACGVVVNVGAGYHSADVHISRPTRIAGLTLYAEGRDAPHASFTEYQVGPKGSLVAQTHFRALVSAGVRNPDGHALEIQDVVFEGARAFGIDQDGGELCLYDVEVKGTRRLEDTDGTGLRLTGGAKALGRDLGFVANERGAIDASGKGTSLQVEGLVVADHQAGLSDRAMEAIGLTEPWGGWSDPFGSEEPVDEESVWRELAVVQANDGAGLFVADYEIADNAHVAVRIGPGATGHLASGEVRDTLAAPLSYSVVVADRGVLELHDTSITNDGVHGIGMLLMEGALVVAPDRPATVEITDHLLGIHQRTPLDLSCLVMLVYDNVLDQDLAELGIPQLSLDDLLNPTSPSSECDLVPWPTP